MSHKRATILDRIHDYLRQENELDLLQTLPVSSALTWRKQTTDKNATRKSLVIGRHKKQELLAVLVEKGKNGYQAKFYTGGDGVNEMTICNSNAVPDMNLVSPFKHIAGQDKNSIRVFSWFIKYYFVAEGLIDDCLGVAFSDFGRRFSHALKLINDAEIRTKSLEIISPAKKGPSTPKQNLDRLNSNHTDYTSTSRRSTLVNKLSGDAVAIQKHLSKNIAIGLLKHIPHVDEMRFEIQLAHEDALPQRLFLGNYTWACVFTETHEIEFLVELDDMKAQPTDIGSFILEDLIYLFNTADSKNLLASRTRLFALINWYFVAAGIIVNLSPRSIHQYGTQLHDALENARKTSAPPTTPPHLLEHQHRNHESVFGPKHVQNIKKGSSQALSPSSLLGVTRQTPLQLATPVSLTEKRKNQSKLLALPTNQYATLAQSSVQALLQGTPQRLQIKELEDRIETLEDEKVRLALLKTKEQTRSKVVGGAKRQLQIENGLENISTELTGLMKKRRKLKMGLEKS